MFMHRLRKFGRASLFALSMLLVGGSLNSCKDWLDDYKYDNEEPDWLGASVYDFLKEGSSGHTYNNFVALIDSLGEKETLAHTGSKTLFVADDAAFERFYENNPWGVKSVGEMTQAQRKVLLYNAMLDNALLLDMMSSTGSGSDKEGTCLRRSTSFAVIDTIPLVDGSFVENHKGWPTYNKYWNVLRGANRSKKMRLAMDGTVPMMVHFFEEYLKNNSISASDIEFLFKKNGVSTKSFQMGDALVFNRKMVTSDIDAGEFSEDTMTITCKNGYVYRLDDVLLPPTNMAGELRLRKDTRIFSHLLDRFCIPVFDAGLTSDFKKRYGENDSIFRLRYFAKDGFSSYELLKTTNSNPLPDELLNYDPGWNTYNNSRAKEEDMAAMFVPKDEVLYDYFASSKGGGRFLIDRFAPNVKVAESYSPESVDLLLSALDSVPQVNVVSFLNNLMKSTFIGTVPSKFEKVTNDANDEMNLEEKHVDECIIANNGVIYILNTVFAPAAYSAVSAPTLVNENMLIMRNIIKQLRYDYYLLAMDAEYSFLVPDDNSFVYYDPVTFGSAVLTPTMYKFHYDKNRPEGNGATELWAEKFYVNSKTLEIDSVLKYVGPYGISGSNFDGGADAAFMKNRMTDIMEYLIIVHDEGEAFSPNKQYYSTKGYGTVKVDASDASNIKIYGGEQIETGTEMLVAASHTMENGITYNTVAKEQDIDSVRFYSSIPTPPTKSVYTNMQKYGATDTDIYYEFFQLCSPNDFSNLLEKMFKETAEDYETSKADSLRLYSIFLSESDGTAINTVPFFNTYHYTVYVPSNASIKDMYARGLPTWEQVKECAEKYPLKAASAMRQINSFIRHHFQDNSVYHDKSEFTIPSPEGAPYKEATFATSVINNETGRFYETLVKSAANNATIIVKDQLTDKNDENAWAKVVNTPGQENITWNVMCRDIIYEVNSSKEPTGIATSSFAVIQPLDRALLNKGMFGYDGRFRRFAQTGDPVDIITVSGGAAGNAGNGAECYLVAKSGKKDIQLNDTLSVEAETAYLMKPITSTDSEWNETMTREALITIDDAPVLITTDGYLLEVIEDTEMETTVIRFKTVKGTDGKDYKIMVDNNGVEISGKRLPLYN